MNIVSRWFNLRHGAASLAKACRTRMVSEQFFVCRVKKPNPKYCEHSLSMGDGYLCRHSDRARFADK